MIQRFIYLGEGYSDFYELLTLGSEMSHRVEHLIAFHTNEKENSKTSVAIVMKPTTTGDFQPIYMCKEGFTQTSKRFDLFKGLAEELDKKVIEITVQPSTHFGEQELYFQHLIGILRTNHFISPLK
ncbi:DUF7147 family protein [Salinibacillus xinjiangensis]|uniref:Methylthioribose kinase n=1 Tax=Salinibacillus xinjiangensis TaxID=1229268 RepID=A0A6G1X3J5_9BACI|nr:methylthioribose kinase [Salinibacillus xinjiangensis]MRG85517.1 methylthioribose kinase [Salinibacillus xinjiangensis]